VGKFAARLAMEGHDSGSVAIVRTTELGVGQPYGAAFKRIELRDVAAKTKHMPPEFIEGHNGVSRLFVEYCKPLVGELPVFDRLSL